MANVIRLGQAFYGSGRDGYRVQGITDRRHSGDVEKLCNAIGTPDGISTVSPFLINLPVRETLFMACVRPGAKDSSGRQTLFFHVFYGSLEDCRRGGLSAFALLRRGMFAGHPDDDCQSVAVEPEPAVRRKTPSPFVWTGEKLAVIAAAPQNELLESLLGDRATDVPWASFSFAALPDFRIYAISEFVTPPEDRECRDTTGKLLAAAPSEHSAGGEKAPRSGSGASRSFVPILLLVLSVLLNMLLGWLLIKGTASGTCIRTDELQALAQKFPPEMIIDDVNEIRELADFVKECSDRKAALVKKMSVYVNYCNENILKISKKENRP